MFLANQLKKSPLFWETPPFLATSSPKMMASGYLTRRSPSARLRSIDRCLGRSVSGSLPKKSVLSAVLAGLLASMATAARSIGARGVATSAAVWIFGRCIASRPSPSIRLRAPSYSSTQSRGDRKPSRMSHFAVRRTGSSDSDASISVLLR